MRSFRIFYYRCMPWFETLMVTQAYIIKEQKKLLKIETVAKGFAVIELFTSRRMSSSCLPADALVARVTKGEQ